MGRSHSRAGERGPGSPWFYRHLVASSAAQLVVVIVALATGSMTPWCAAAVLVGTLGICAHASVALSPRARGSGRRP